MRATQSQRIIQYLKENGSISSREAYTELGVMRLAPRIAELKRVGYSIASKLETYINRYGDKVHYARYELISCPATVQPEQPEAQPV